MDAPAKEAPAATPAASPKEATPVEQPAPAAEEAPLPKIDFTPANELRANTRAKFNSALASVKRMTNASTVTSTLTRTLGKPTWIENDTKRVWVTKDTDCVRLVQQEDGSVDLEIMRFSESKMISPTKRQNLCTGEIESAE